MKVVKRILIVLLVILIAIQFYRPEMYASEYNTIAQFEAETEPTEQVKRILESKCYDCHSDNTNYPWYAQIAPISYWIADHVKEGKEHFNVSNWSIYSVKRKDHKLEELIEEVEGNKMPEDSYTWLHGNLSDKDKEALITWAKGVRASYTIKN